MGSASISDASQKELNDDLLDVGNRLLRFRSSITDELLVLLERAESILEKVWQQPPTSTAKSLFPMMKALASDTLLRHDDVNIQVAVASCMNELTRITAPDTPYPDDVMKVIFRLLMVPLKQLSDESTSNYSTPLKILEYMAKVKSCLLMMDIDLDELIIEMFQLFLSTIRSDHPSDIFKYMQTIMTTMIEESDEISHELLKPLLDSVRRDNKNISPLSWELGKIVIEKCASQLRRYLKEAIKTMNLDIDDYAEVVGSLCKDTSNGKNMTVESSAKSKPKKPKLQKNLPAEKEKKRRRSHGIYGKELVNSRIQVWWPLDKAFYSGTVTAFDPVTKKHKVRYDDDEYEVLDLKNEKWKPVTEEVEPTKPLNIEHDSQSQ